MNLNRLREVETKILDTTEAQLLPRLQALGFERHFEGILKTQWLMNRHNKKELRVRQKDDIIMVEHETKVSREDSTEQCSTDITDFNAVITELIGTWFSKVGISNIKRRVSYILDITPEEKVYLDFDTYSQLIGGPIPEFLRIKASCIGQIELVIQYLGLEKSDCQNYGPKNLFAHYYPEVATL